MVSSIVLVLLLTSFAYGRPSADVGDEVKVSNCSPDQKLQNGKCYNVSLLAKLDELIPQLNPQSIFENEPLNVVTVPGNCPPGQHFVNGACRNIFRILLQKLLEEQSRNVITVPPNCLPGQQLINGQCRDIFFRSEFNLKNVITVPPNCLPGQELVNGICRDIFLRNVTPPNPLQENKINDISDTKLDVHGKNIISIPSQCPKGFKPDSNGICRPILKTIL